MVLKSIFYVTFFCSLSLCQAQQMFTHYFPQYTDSTTGKPSTKFVREQFDGIIQGTDTIKTGKYASFYFETTDTLQSGHYQNDKKNGLFTDYFENGVLKWQRRYINDIPTGTEIYIDIRGNVIFKSEYQTEPQLINGETHYITKATQYYPDGTPASYSTLLDGEKNGNEMQLYKSGSIKSTSKFEKGMQQGYFEIYGENKLLLQKGTYVNNLLEDTLYSYYNSGELKTKAVFKKGLPNGIMSGFYRDSTLKRKANYQQDTLHGNFISFYPNGQKQSEGVYKKGKLDSVYQQYYENGTVALTQFFVQGLKEGIEKITDENNRLINLNYYTKDALNGICFTYYPSGNIYKKLNFNQGIKTGENFIYYENGALKEKYVVNTKGQTLNTTNYNEKRNVIETIVFDYKPNKTAPQKTDVLKEKTNFYPSGKIESTQYFLNGLKHGKWIFYYENKKKQLEEEYKFNLLTGVRIAYFENGKKKTEQHYIGGNLQGISTTYSKTRKLIEEATYKRNKLDGAYTAYDAKGNKTMVGNYKNDLKDGEWIVYDEKGSIKESSVFKRGKLITTHD